MHSFKILIENLNTNRVIIVCPANVPVGLKKNILQIDSRYCVYVFSRQNKRLL